MSRARGLIIWLACCIAAAWSLAALLWDVLRGENPTRQDRVAVGFDQTLNAALGGWPDETLSARSFRLRLEASWATWKKRIDWIFGDNMHCHDSYRAEQRRMQTAPEYRT